MGGAAETLAPVVAESPVAGDHVYVVPPDAVKVVPLQPPPLLPALTEGSELTLTVTIALPLQPAVLPVTVYVVVVEGEAVTLLPVVAERPAPGDHVYVLPPVAVKVVVLPAQMPTFALALTDGVELTLTVTTALLLQLLASVPVTV